MGALPRPSLLFAGPDSASRFAALCQAGVPARHGTSGDGTIVDRQQLLAIGVPPSRLGACPTSRCGPVSVGSWSVPVRRVTWCPTPTISPPARCSGCLSTIVASVGGVASRFPTHASLPRRLPLATPPAACHAACPVARPRSGDIGLARRLVRATPLSRVRDPAACSIGPCVHLSSPSSAAAALTWRRWRRRWRS